MVRMVRTRIIMRLIYDVPDGYAGYNCQNSINDRAMMVIRMDKIQLVLGHDGCNGRNPSKHYDDDGYDGEKS